MLFEAELATSFDSCVQVKFCIHGIVSHMGTFFRVRTTCNNGFKGPLLAGRRKAEVYRGSAHDICCRNDNSTFLPYLV